MTDSKVPSPYGSIGGLDQWVCIAFILWQMFRVLLDIPKNRQEYLRRGVSLGQRSLADFHTEEFISKMSEKDIFTIGMTIMACGLAYSRSKGHWFFNENKMRIVALGFHLQVQNKIVRKADADNA